MRYLLHDVLTSSVKTYPQKVAIHMENGEEVTYSELNKLSNQFANLIKSKKENIQDSPFVGILSSVHIQSIAAVLGTLKIGGAYVPLDEYSPTERLLSIIENTQLDTIVIDPVWYEKHKDLFKSSFIKNVIFLQSTDSSISEKTISFETVQEASTDEPKLLNQVSDDLAYILHSSGSTGVPKGIMLTHRNARTFVDWMHKEFELDSDDVVMSRAPFKFDLSVFDIFNTFKAGAKLVCFNWNRVREGDQKHIDYVKLIESQNATILYTTPSTFIVLMNRGELETADIKLEKIMYAGEPFPTPQLRKLQGVLPNTRIANIYGPTETNIITYWWIDEIPEDDSPIPLGYVVDDTEIIVVSDEKNKICEPNEVGELWCRGGTVTLGYLGMEAKTKEHQVSSPFHKYPTSFWKTGDYGYKDENGILHYRGRRDHMVKVKGYRIEIGEVESGLAKCEKLDEFVVVAVPDEKYGNRLYCYYSVLNSNKLTPVELQKFVSKKIPTYMVPYKFIELKVLPKTSSGKVDRVKLAKISKEK